MSKQKRPYPSYPLTPHANGGWVKKHRGKVYSFAGTPEEALQKWHALAATLDSKAPQGVKMGLSGTVGDLCNLWFDMQVAKQASGRITPSALAQARKAAESLVEYFGRQRPLGTILPAEMQRLGDRIASRLAPSTAALTVRWVRGCLRFGVDSGWLEGRVLLGLRGPTKGEMRRAKRLRGPADFTPDQVRQLWAVANAEMRAWMALGLFAGYQQIDLSEMGPWDGGEFLDGARVKSGIDRRAWLPEVARDALRNAPPPWRNRDGGKLVGSEVVLDKKGLPDERRTDAVAARWKRLKAKAVVTGAGFVGLRRTCATIGIEAGLTPALRVIMGHADQSTLGHYIQRIPDEMLRRVGEHLRTRLDLP